MKIFCKDKFLAETKHFELYHQNEASWPNGCHGRAVEERTVHIVDKMGFKVSYGVMQNWCIDSKPLVEYFKKENVAIHVGDGWEFDTFMKMLGEAGIHWASGEICCEDYRPELITSLNFGKNRVKVKTSDAEERCVRYVSGFGIGVVTQGSVEYFKRLEGEGNDKVLEYSDFINLGYKLEKLENGTTTPDSVTYHMGARGCGKSIRILSTFIDELDEDKEVWFTQRNPFDEFKKSIHQSFVDCVMNQPYDIHISSDGKTTTAKFYVNGKVVREAEAKCHPEDRFNFRTGAELAFDRLWEKKPKEKKIEEEMPKADLKNLKVGDKVRVRDDLVSGEFYNGFCFSHNLEKFRGKEVTIRRVSTFKPTRPPADETVIYLIEEDDHGWIFTPPMLEEI